MLKPLVYSVALAAALTACDSTAGRAADAAPAPSPEPASASATPNAPRASTPPAQSSDTATGIATLLARVPPDTALDSLEARALMAAFPDGCANEPRLPFEKICEHYAPDADANDPSPWPDVVVGIDEGRVVALALLEPSLKPAPGWRCDAVEGVDGVRACAAETESAGRSAWRKAWQGFFSAAD